MLADDNDLACWGKTWTICIILFVFFLSHSLRKNQSINPAFMDNSKLVLYAAVIVAVYYVFFRKGSNGTFEFFQDVSNGPMPQHPQHHHHHYEERIPDAAGTQEIYARAFPS